MGIDKRKLPRARKRFKVTLGGATLFTADVSVGGFAAEAMRVLAPGTEVHGELQLGDQRFPFTGRVC